MVRLAALCALLLASPALGLEREGVTLDPRGLVRPALLEAALGAYDAHAAKLAKPTIAIVDFAKPSSEPRLFLLNLETGVVEAMLVAHGKGSDGDHDGLAEVFSDKSGSMASTLGAFRAGERYQGGHGLSLRLDGLEAGNKNARARQIVLHAQWYVSPAMVAAHGKLGRSWGCFVVERGLIAEVVARLEDGGLVYAGR